MKRIVFIICCSMCFLCCSKNKTSIEHLQNDSVVNNKEVVEDSLLVEDDNDDMFKYLNSIEGHDECDTIIGNFTGRSIDTLYVVSIKNGNPEWDEEAMDYWAVCSNPAVPRQRLLGHTQFQPKLVFEGDLDRNGKDEWGYLHTWLNSQWRTYRVFTLVGKEWRYLTNDWDLLCTPEYFRGSGREVIEPGPRKGTIKINYGQWSPEIKFCDTIITPNFAKIDDDD